MSKLCGRIFRNSIFKCYMITIKSTVKQRIVATVFRWSQHWVKVVIPASVCNVENLYIHWDVSGAESLVCDGDGNVLQGLSHKRKEFKVVPKCPDQDMVYFIQVSCTGDNDFCLSQYCRYVNDMTYRLL